MPDEGCLQRLAGSGVPTTADVSLNSPALGSEDLVTKTGIDQLRVRTEEHPAATCVRVQKQPGGNPDPTVDVVKNPSRSTT
jgi:hypothetical protein